MSNNKQERIVCAAIKVSLVKDGYQGINIVTGVDYKSIVEGGLISEISHPTYCNIFIRGFITNKNRFVDPKEAADIALEFDQVISVNKLWDAFGQAQEEVEKDLLQEKIYQKGSQILQEGLKPEDLY